MFLERADHRKGEAADAKRLADGGILAAVHSFREVFGDNGDLAVFLGVELIEETSREYIQFANVPVLRIDAEHQNVLFLGTG